MKQAFQPEADRTPPCLGCEACNTSKPGVLYSFQHGGRWLCAKCFFRLNPTWPRPASMEDEPAKTTMYTLTEEDMERAKKFAEIKDRKYKDKDWTRDWGPDHNLIGAMGEVAFWRVTGLKPRESASGDGGFDFEKRGTSIQLKTRKGAGAPFMIPEKDWKKGVKALLIVHARVIGENKVEFVGWVKKDKLKRCVPITEGVRVPTMTLYDREWNPDFTGFMETEK